MKYIRHIAAIEAGGQLYPDEQVIRTEAYEIDGKLFRTRDGAVAHYLHDKELNKLYHVLEDTFDHVNIREMCDDENLTLDVVRSVRDEIFFGLFDTIKSNPGLLRLVAGAFASVVDAADQLEPITNHRPHHHREEI